MKLRLNPHAVPFLAVLAAGVAVHEGAHATVLNMNGTTTKFRFYGIAAATKYDDSAKQPSGRVMLLTLVAGPVAELAFYSMAAYFVPELAPMLSRVAFLQLATNLFPVIPGSDGWRLGKVGLGLWQDRRLFPAYRCPRHRPSPWLTATRPSLRFRLGLPI